MSDTEADEWRPKRQKRDTNGAAKAFNKFKELKSGKGNKYEIKELESVYETVVEKKYVKRVLDKQDDDCIIVDDDGSDIFDDDLLDSGSIAEATARGKGAKRKKENVADNAGKGTIPAMFSSMSAKKKQEVKIEDDDILSQILGEIDDVPTSSSKLQISSHSAFVPRKQVVQDYLKTFNKPSQKIGAPIRKLTQNKSTPKVNDVVKSEVKLLDSIKEVGNGDYFEDTPNRTKNISKPLEKGSTEKASEGLIEDCGKSGISETQKEIASQMDTMVEPDVNGFDTSLYGTWTQHNNDENIKKPAVVDYDPGELPLVDVNGTSVFRFFYWDAFEDPEKQKGVVFLFGKTYCEKAKAYVSCCVAVRNIDRQVFVLPRQFKLDKNGEETDQPVTYKDLYEEFNEMVLKSLNIGQVRSRYVRKKYAFDPSVPIESDYMEVQYSAKESRINLDNFNKIPKTFSKVFGAYTSCLERLLLNRSIKGPCWLEITDPVAVTNPYSWCKHEVNCMNMSNMSKSEQVIPVPPLVVSSISLRTVLNPKTAKNEIVMISCVTQTKYAVDKQAPEPCFNHHFCVFCPSPLQSLPLNMHEHIKNYKRTKLQKMDCEKALIQYFIRQVSKIDPDLIVGHDLHGYQMTLLADRLQNHCVRSFDILGKLKRSEKKKLQRELFVGRLVCDIKISAKELSIKSRTYELDALCQTVLKMTENQRMDLESDQIAKMFQTPQDILKLVTCTMQDSVYIMKIMYDLNIIPLALQITNIAGNVMSKTLLGGRSEIIEFLLLHAFTKKGYIVPEKTWKRTSEQEKNTRKKPTYAGGLVLEPKVGFYDTLILLMDFNSLYPSIIQEYNICFTTLPVSDDAEEDIQVPSTDSPMGILPVEMRKLVDSRKQVKRLMKQSNLSPDLQMQYHIRQMALKLTANSMYGCLGCSNSRFYAKNLAALVTQKGREILMNTKDLVEKMNFDVLYGDTDSIMINTNILDYGEVIKIGMKIKQEVNKIYKHIELDIDGVFKYLLLLKKKKYAAVTLSQTRDGKIKEEKEYKGVDIVRRDWSPLACETGKFVLDHILCEQPQDDRIQNIHKYLTKIPQDLENGKMPLRLLTITKQLTKDPIMYADKNTLPHVQVAIRFNENHGGHFRAGDTVPYVMCKNGTDKGVTQRAYHPEELKNSEHLKVDSNYYLSQQIHPVVSRICEPISGTGPCEIAECLGLDPILFKKRHVQKSDQVSLESMLNPEVKFKNVEKFKFKCAGCKSENIYDGPFRGNTSVLEKCSNNICIVRPIDHLYHQNQLTCEDPDCANVSTRVPLGFIEEYPVCTRCQQGVMIREYSEKQLYVQCLEPHLDDQFKYGYQVLQACVHKYSGYSVVDLDKFFGEFLENKKKEEATNTRALRSLDFENISKHFDEDNEEDEFQEMGSAF